MIRTAIRTTAVAAALAGASFSAAPAFAGVHNRGYARHDTVTINVIGGYGVTCVNAGVASNAGQNCSHNTISNSDDSNSNGNH